MRHRLRRAPLSHADSLSCLLCSSFSVLRPPICVPAARAFAIALHLGSTHLSTAQCVCCPLMPALTLRKQHSPSGQMGNCANPSQSALDAIRTTQSSSPPTSTGRQGKLSNNQSSSSCHTDHHWQSKAAFGRAAAAATSRSCVHARSGLCSNLMVWSDLCQVGQAGLHLLLELCLQERRERLHRWSQTQRSTPI